MTGWRISGAPPRSSARRSIDRSPRPDRERNARDHEHHRVAHCRHALIHAAEQISKAQPRRGLGMHALADLVGHHGEARLTSADEPGEGVGFIEDRLVAIAAQQAIGDPEREAIDDEGVAGTLELLQTRHEVERHLDRGPVRWALRAMPRDATGHICIERLGRRHEGDATLGGALLDGVATLAAARAADHEERCGHLPGSSREDRLRISARAGLLALGSSYSPRLPDLFRSVAPAGFVPDHSDGVAAAWTAFPEALTAIPSANNVANANKIGCGSQPRRPSRAQPFEMLSRSRMRRERLMSIRCVSSGTSRRSSQK